MPTKTTKINVAMLHPRDIENIENAFRGLIENRMDYSIDDMGVWLKTYFIGQHEDTREFILKLAKEVKDSHT